MIHILVAEDEKAIREGLEDLLSSEGYSVVSASNGEQAIQLYHSKAPDMVILDIMMPKKSGYDVCREIRKEDISIPVLFLSAREEEIDKVLGLELGADDYIVKPFGVRELLARIKCALRRSQNPLKTLSRQTPFSFGNCTVDPGRFSLIRDRLEYSLSEREVALLIWFYDNPDTVHSRADLLEKFWGITYEGTTRTLDQHIAKLRKKVEGDPSSPEHILTVHRTGYRFRK